MFLLKATRGFTLIELLVVIAIISLLSSIVLASLGNARVKARDSKRIQELLQIRTALELYRDTEGNGKYPLNPLLLSNPSLAYWGTTCWDCDPGYALNDPNKLIALAPYLPQRPQDPSGPFPLSPSSLARRGYRYKVSDLGTHYKMAILGSVENMNNVPELLKDTNFYVFPAEPTNTNHISVYSDDFSKSWTASNCCTSNSNCSIGPYKIFSMCD